MYSSSHYFFEIAYTFAGLIIDAKVAGSHSCLLSSRPCDPLEFPIFHFPLAVTPRMVIKCPTSANGEGPAPDTLMRAPPRRASFICATSLVSCVAVRPQCSESTGDISQLLPTPGICIPLSRATFAVSAGVTVCPVNAVIIIAIEAGPHPVWQMVSEPP